MAGAPTSLGKPLSATAVVAAAPGSSVGEGEARGVLEVPGAEDLVIVHHVHVHAFGLSGGTGCDHLAERALEHEVAVPPAGRGVVRGGGPVVVALGDERSAH